jgi:hypothetical protein
VQERRFIRRPVDQPVLVQGWAKEGVIASYAVDPDRSPFVWDPDSGTVTPVRGAAAGWPSYVAHSPLTGDWVLFDTLSGCTIVIDRLGGAARKRVCAMSLSRPATFLPQGRLLAATSGDTVRILDAGMSDTGEGHAMPAGSSPMQIIAEGGAGWLVVVADPQDGVAYVLRCAGSGTCERAVTGRPGERITLVANP